MPKNSKMEENDMEDIQRERRLKTPKYYWNIFDKLINYKQSRL